MQVVEGDMWSYLGKRWVVVTTNIGWRWKAPEGAKVGANVMGAGVAREASERFDDLALMYGHWCWIYQEETTTCFSRKHGLILLPTKELDVANPALSWKRKSSLELIEKSVQRLAILDLPDGVVEERELVVLPMPGCGSGGLKEAQVRPILEKHLDDRFTLVLKTHPF